MQRDENLVYVNNGSKIDAVHMMPFTWVTVRPGRSTPADLVQSRSTQIGPRSVSKLESVLTLVQRTNLYRHAIFVKIRHIVVEILQFFNLQAGGPVILDFHNFKF